MITVSLRRAGSGGEAYGQGFWSLLEESGVPSDLGAHQIWLTPEGHQVDKVSVLLYAKPAQESLIAQKARLDGIASELENLAPELSAAEAAFKQAETAVRSSETQHKNLMQQ